MKEIVGSTGLGLEGICGIMRTCVDVNGTIKIIHNGCNVILRMYSCHIVGRQNYKTLI